MRFRHVRNEDRETVHKWLQKPYVAKWFYGDGLENTYRHLDQFLIEKTEWAYWIAYEEKPFALLITSPEGKGTTLDLLIGEEDYLGRGLAVPLIQQFLLTEFPDVDTVLIDPEATNQRAVHVYKKAGFKIKKEFIPSHSPHPHYMMQWTAPSIAIRPYREGDANELGALYYNTVHQINARDYTQEQLEAWAPKDGGDWKRKFFRTNPFVATKDDHVVGFAEFDLSGYIDCFYCHHQWQGKGVGLALMRAIHSQVKKHKISRIFADVSITARPFFEKYGFTVISELEVERKGVKLKNFKMEKTFHG